MIICFSGTGNSRRVADQIQDLLGDELVRLPPGIMRNPARLKLEVYDDRVIWVFPIHSWGLPKKVEQAMSQGIIFGRNPLVHHMVATCGDDIGNADKMWRGIARQRGWKTGVAYSVQMPNTYTFMRGFDVDTPEVATAKLEAAVSRVTAIAEAIDKGDPVTDVARGSWAWVKSSVIRPWFNKYKTRTEPFRHTDACTGCGKCSRNCPEGVISMTDGRPRWRAGHCIICERCYHCCPSHAVAYGKATDGKGQYICPGFSIKD